MTMLIKLTTEAHAALAEPLQAEYVERDGAMWLDATAVDGFEVMNPSVLKGTLTKERKRADAAEKSLKPFEGIDDPDAARDAVKTLADLGDLDELKDLDAKVEKRAGQLKEKYESERTRLISKHEDEIADRDTANAGLTTQLHDELITSAATKAIGDEKGSVELLLPVIRQHVQVRENRAGKLAAMVIGADNEPRLSPAGSSTDEMTIAELVGEFKTHDTYQRAFDGSGASGGGSGNSGGAGGGGNTHRISDADAHDPAKYQAAKEAADKSGQQLEIAAPVQVQ